MQPRDRRRQQPEERREVARGRDPQRGSEADRAPEGTTEEPSDRQRAPHEEAHAGVHAPLEPARTQRLADADLVHVVGHAREMAVAEEGSPVEAAT